MKYKKGDRVVVARPHTPREGDEGVHTVVFAHDKFHPPVLLDNDHMYDYDELDPAQTVPKRSALQVEIDRIYGPPEARPANYNFMPPPKAGARPADADEYEYVRCTECGAGYGVKVDLIDTGYDGTVSPEYCMYCGGVVSHTTEDALMKHDEENEEEP
jgi:hypothetical protein